MIKARCCFPETWRSIKDSAPRRKEFFHLSSIAAVRASHTGGTGGPRSWAGNSRPVRHAKCELRWRADSIPFKLGLIEPAADNSQAELMLKDAVDRRIRDRMNPLQCLVRIVRHSRGIAQK